MNAIVKRWQGISLILRILVGLILGAVLGVVAPNLTILTILGDIFVGALKAVAPVLVFVLVIASLANASVGIGNRFRTVVVLYMPVSYTHLVLQHHAARGNAAVVANVHRAQDLRAGANQHVVADGGVTFAGVFSGAAQGYLVVNRAVVTDFGGFAEHRCV